MRRKLGRSTTLTAAGALSIPAKVAVISTSPRAWADKAPQLLIEAIAASDDDHSAKKVTSRLDPSLSWATAVICACPPIRTCAGPETVSDSISSGSQLGTQTCMTQSVQSSQLETQTHRSPG